MRPSAVRMMIATIAVCACADTEHPTESSASAAEPSIERAPPSSSDSATSGSSGAAGGAGPSVQVAGSPARAAAGASMHAAGSGVVGMAGMAGMHAVPAGGAGAPAAGAAGTALPTSTGCDRACLMKVMEGYTDALVAQDSSRITVSSSLKYTENGVPVELGETVWTTAMSIVPDTTLSFADPVEKQVASQFVFAESGSTQKIYQVRLKVDEGAITEIESMVVKSGDQFFNPAGMKPEPVFLEAVEPAKRSTREELLAITELYLEYLEGSTRAADIPFDEGCKRYENGTVTASGLTSFNSQSWSFDVTHRILVVDEEAGITWGMFPFQQSESALVVGEAFKIIEGKMMMIQAVMTYMPSKAWD